MAMLLENSDVIGSGPTGSSVLLNLNFIFKPTAAGQTFRVEARMTNDAGIEKGYEPIGTMRFRDSFLVRGAARHRVVQEAARL